MNEEWLGVFALQMEDAGWVPVADAFGGVYEWRHGRSGKTVFHEAALNYWWMSGQLPQHTPPSNEEQESNK
jgi:hypothetical protein